MLSGLETKKPAIQAAPGVRPFDHAASPDGIATPARPSVQMGALLEFQDQALEQEFRTQFVVSQLKHIRMAVLAAVFLMYGFGIIDAILYGDEINHLLVWSTRLLFFTPMAIAFIIFTYKDLYIKNAQTIGFSCVIIVGLTWTLMISDGVHRSMFLMPNLVESALYSLFFLGLTLRFSLPATIFLPDYSLLSSAIVVGFPHESQRGRHLDGVEIGVGSKRAE